jgi:hypothetical protein
MGENDGPTRPVPQLCTQYRRTMIAMEMPTTASGARAAAAARQRPPADGPPAAVRSMRAGRPVGHRAPRAQTCDIRTGAVGHTSGRTRASMAAHLRRQSSALAGRR